MSSAYVLDSWALIALMKSEEPAASRVRQVLDEAAEQGTVVALSVINLGEINYIIGRARGAEAAHTALAQIEEMPIVLLPVDRAFVLAAAHYKMHYAISYADAFAAATAAKTDGTLLTGDPELLTLQHLIRIEPLTRSKQS